MNINPSKYIINEGQKVKLDKISPACDDDIDKDKGAEEIDRLLVRLEKLQELLYADSSKAILIILQAMDAAGKDSTIRKVFGPLNPQGCTVAPFKAPSALELGHDFLWRIHRETPKKGMIAVFNRSHYEDVLVVRVKKLAQEKTIEKRYDHINAFERLLDCEGTKVIKIYLHISKDYQKARLEKRLADPEKRWKFNPEDIGERSRWDEYMSAYEEALSRCSTKKAPWYVVPAETRWFRNLLVARIVVDALEAMDLKFPEPDFDPTAIKIE